MSLRPEIFNLLDDTSFNPHQQFTKTAQIQSISKQKQQQAKIPCRQCAFESKIRKIENEECTNKRGLQATICTIRQQKERSKHIGSRAIFQRSFSQFASTNFQTLIRSTPSNNQNQKVLEPYQLQDSDFLQQTSSICFIMTLCIIYITISFMSDVSLHYSTYIAPYIFPHQYFFKSIASSFHHNLLQSRYLFRKTHKWGKYRSIKS